MVPQPRTLDKMEKKKLQKWLISYNCFYRPARMQREFSDPLTLACIIKKFCPKLVNILNYPPCGSITLKLSNWEALNRKVLDKLEIKQTNEVLEKLARGDLTAIETLLHAVMKQEEKLRSSEKEYDLLSKKMEGKKMDAQKIAHLENLLRLKDERIQELTRELARSSHTSSLKRDTKQKETRSKIKIKPKSKDPSSVKQFSNNTLDKSVKLDAEKFIMKKNFESLPAGQRFLIRKYRMNLSSDSVESYASANSLPKLCKDFHSATK